MVNPNPKIEPQWDVEVRKVSIISTDQIHLVVEAKGSRLNVIVTPYEYGNLLSLVNLGICVPIGDLSDYNYIVKKLKKYRCNLSDAQTIAYTLSLFAEYRNLFGK